MLQTLAVAIVLVFLVVFLFLQDWRTTLIPAVTIPVSLVGTFAFVKLFGFSINTITLFGSCSRRASSWTTRSWWSRTSRGTCGAGSGAQRGLRRDGEGI